SYHGPNGTGRASVIHYKGYTLDPYPRDVPPGDHDQKKATADTYGKGDPNYELGRNAYELWYWQMYERFPGSTSWLERSSDGRLAAVTVEDRQLKLWYENTVGGTWTGPVSLNSGGPIAPNVTLLKRPDGKLQIIAMRLPLARETWSQM